ncbi:hypothetical protein JUM001_15410 [Clostridium perfringens]|uniref:hypothetical protein n=1 Tax=Clostridium perfringens TaxID=1502 RepID=UPI0021FC94B4|nr:hypothetical protein [Clostridium perfringens]BDS17307.1 hypothetical protein JUM001_15410 [Clostridium perfringens]
MLKISYGYIDSVEAINLHEKLTPSKSSELKNLAESILHGINKPIGNINNLKVKTLSFKKRK